MTLEVNQPGIYTEHPDYEISIDLNQVIQVLSSRHAAEVAELNRRNVMLEMALEMAMSELNKLRERTDELADAVMSSQSNGKLFKESEVS